jgi:chromosome segregation ATPase
MATLEERVAYLEGRGEEHAGAIGEVRADIRDLRAEVRDLRGDVNQFRGEVNQRFDRLEGKFDSRIDRLEARFDTRFMWMVGFQFMTLMAVVAALLNAYFR